MSANKKTENLKDDGRIKFTLGDYKIVLTPRDMLIQVKSDDPDEE